MRGLRRRRGPWCRRLNARYVATAADTRFAHERGNGGNFRPDGNFWMPGESANVRSGSPRLRRWCGRNTPRLGRTRLSSPNLRLVNVSAHNFSAHTISAHMSPLWRGWRSRADISSVVARRRHGGAARDRAAAAHQGASPHASRAPSVALEQRLDWYHHVLNFERFWGLSMHPISQSKSAPRTRLVDAQQVLTRVR